MQIYEILQFLRAFIISFYYLLSMWLGVTFIYFFAVVIIFIKIF